MLTSSQVFMIQCLSDFLARRKTETVILGLDWKELFSIAKRQSLEGIVFHQCQSLIPDEIRNRYLRRYVGTAVVSFKREEITAEFIRHVEACGIPVIYMKGAVIRNSYPLPPLRSMGDIDLIIHPQDRERVDDIFRKDLGYQCFIDNHAVWTYHQENMFMEVHDHMFYENLANQTDYQAYFDQVWENCHHGTVFGTESDVLFVPDEEFHFLYLMAHTAKHVVNNGSGFRAYLDMAMLVLSAGDQMNWRFIRDELEKLKLLEFTQICFSCCERWFGIKMPLTVESMDEDLFNIITEKTFTDGLFGLDNQDNKQALAAKDISRSSGSYTAAAIKRGIKRLFPPYRDLQLVPWYSFVDGRPWLLPAAWVYRFGYCAVRKMKESREYLLEPFTKKKAVQARRELLQRWGL